jgi:hypothetical protein
LNICNDKTVQFLDLEISLDKLYNKLNFSLYIKKTNTFSYLNVNSNHPKHIFKNIPKSLFIRVRRICTKFTDYLYYCRLIYLHLIKCGYDANLLDKLINIVGRIDRKELIDYKVNNTIKTQQDFIQQCPIVSQVTSIVQLVSEDVSGALETQKKC